MLAFTLTMPQNNSWNNRWSGRDKLFCIVKKFPNTAKYLVKEMKLDGKSFTHNFGDGWVAQVSVKRVDSFEARSLRKRSHGFCGYDWMIDSILAHGKIQIHSDVVQEISK